MVELLLFKGANIHEKLDDGFTCFHIACYNGFNDIVDILLDNNADVNVGNVDNITGLHLACQQGYFDVV
jgi:ankyrin repeat protein